MLNIIFYRRETSNFIEQKNLKTIEPQLFKSRGSIFFFTTVLTLNSFPPHTGPRIPGPLFTTPRPLAADLPLSSGVVNIILKLTFWNSASNPA